MNHLNDKISPFDYCAEDIFNDCVKFEENKLFLTNDISPEIIFQIEEIVGFQLQVHYIEKKEIYPICNSKLNKNGPVTFLLNKIRKIENQQYFCSNKKCNYYKLSKLICLLVLIKYFIYFINKLI
jgi:hypothetical protein